MLKRRTNRVGSPDSPNIVRAHSVWGRTPVLEIVAKFAPKPFADAGDVNIGWLGKTVDFSFNDG